MIQILINNKQHQLGAPLPAHIFHASFTISPLTTRIQIPLDQAIALKHWFNQFIDACRCEWIFVNNTYYRVDELTPFKDI